MRLVNIVQHMWLTGEIPQELGWIILSLIPKGSTYSQCIGLLETLWKVVEVIIDTRLRTSIHFHDVIYGLWARKGMRTAIMKLKVSQELASVDHNPRLLVFLDLRKTYDTVYRGRLIWTLEGYGAGPRLCELLATFWDHQKVLPQQNGYHGPTFPATRGTNQGGLVSPILFNAVIDNIIR